MREPILSHSGAAASSAAGDEQIAGSCEGPAKRRDRGSNRFHCHDEFSGRHDDDE